MAENFSAEGYVVLAPDTYRGSVASTVPGALALRLSADTVRVESAMMAAFAYLAEQPNVDLDRIAVMGFCFGGGVALRHGVENPQIAATINLYGDVIDNPDDFGPLLDSGRPILGIFGAADQQIPVSEVEAFETALEQAGIPHTVNVYPPMPHAFVHPGNIGEPGEPQNA
ncbi:MAG: dienelactone hydrolase family protein [bacterium]|nr:dienelactone hydrolase family protein [bacterium]